MRGTEMSSFAVKIWRANASCQETSTLREHQVTLLVAHSLESQCENPKLLFISLAGKKNPIYSQ